MFLPKLLFVRQIIGIKSNERREYSFIGIPDFLKFFQEKFLKSVHAQL